MKIYATPLEQPNERRKSVLAIGNFDGVHRGHQALLKTAKDIAVAQNVPLAVLTFEPHPRSIFRPDDPPFRLTPPSLKAQRLEACGVDILYSLPFDWDFASQSAEVFTDRVLKNGIAPSHIVIGADFRFGQLRAGTPKMLRDTGFKVTTLEKISMPDGSPFSSSIIRQALRDGDIKRANAMLGWEWMIEGAVVHGDKRGREIGYPTANVPLGKTLHPAYGIYAAWVQVEDEKEWHPAALNVGIRPMFELSVGQVEAHILGGFNRDIYGNTLRIRPVQRLRGEARFESIESLIAQIGKDCEAAMTILIQNNASAKRHF